MSSLVTTASVWTSDDPSTKKRQSTMRKTIKLRSEPQSNYDETTLESDKYGKMSPSTIDDQQSYNSNRNNRVNELLNQITSSDTSADNNTLGNFKPMTPPSLNVKRDMESSGEVKQYVPPPPSYLKATIDRATAFNGYTDPTSTSPKTFSNYQQSYGAPLSQIANKPYYASMGIGAGTGGAASGSDKMMEKINYMIHLLEEGQSEKTNNITEEFILYTFLGVFIIFIVDSFSRGGKYVR